MSVKDVLKARAVGGTSRTSRTRGGWMDGRGHKRSCWKTIHLDEEEEDSITPASQPASDQSRVKARFDAGGRGRERSRPCARACVCGRYRSHGGCGRRRWDSLRARRAHRSYTKGTGCFAGANRRYCVRREGETGTEAERVSTNSSEEPSNRRLEQIDLHAASWCRVGAALRTDHPL